MKSLQNISSKVKNYFNNATWDDEIKQKFGQFASNPKINNLANNFNTQVNQARTYQQQNPTSRVLKDYVNNTYVAAAKDIPQAISGIVKPQPLNIGGFRFGSKSTRVLNAGRLGLDVLGAVPDPTDIAFAGANYLKGYKQARNQGSNLVQSLQSGEQTMAGNKYVGLGDSIPGLTENQRTAGNLAELPLVLAAGFARNRAGAKQSIEQALKNEQAITELVGATKNWKILPQENQIGFIDNLRRVAEQVIPDVVNNKEFRKQTATDPDTWIKTTSRFLEEALTAAKNPDKLDNFGFQAKPLRKLDAKIAQGGLTDVSQAGTKETGKIAGIRMSNRIPEPTETFRSADALSQGKQTTQSVLDKIATGTQTQSLKQILQSKKTSSDDIISEGRKAIGSEIDSSKRSTRQVFNDLYTQWVDRYHPISRASKKAKIELKGKNAQLRPEFDPDYLVRRLTGAGGVADNRFKTELNPILKQVEDSGIDKSDMDTYLAHNRMIGFDEVGREIYGVDPIKSRAVVQALEQKYPEINKLAQEFYSYEDKGFQELVEAGFINAKDAQGIRSANPNYAPLYRVRDELDDYLGLPTRKTMQGTSPIKGLKGSKRKILSPVESIIGDTFSQRAAIEKNRVATSIVDLNKVADMGFEKVNKSGSDTITVWRDGKKEFWRVGNDIADTAKGVNEEATNTVLKIIQAPAQLLRQGATGRNPEFMVPNIIRDQIDAGITSKYGYIPFIDFASGLKSMIRNEDVYQSWQKSGAKIDLGELSGRKSISKFVDEKKNKRNLFQWIGAGLDVLGKYSEQPTRVGLYKKALNKTGNPLLAAMESRDATVDFARMGSKMKVANSIIPFLNVGVQGFDKLVRATKERPGRVLFNAAIYGAAPALMTTLYNLLNFKEEYMEIPQYEKDSNFVLVIGRNADGTVDYRTFPKGNVVPFIANPVQSLMEHFAGADEQGFKAMALRTLSDGLPVLSGGGSLKEIGLKTIGSNLPQAVKPITESLINKSFYRYDERKGEAKDIVPFYMKDKPAYQQDYEFTPQMYKKIGAVVNVSPLQVKNLMEGYLAGYVKIPAQVIEAVYKTANGEPINPNDKTLIRRFAKQTYPTSKTKTVEEVPEVPNIFKRVFGDTKEASAAEELPTIDNDFKVMYEDATKIVSGYADNSSKIRTGLKDTQTLEEAQTELVQAQNVLRKMEQEQPERVYKIGLDVYESGGGKTTEERADWAYEWLGKAKDEKQYKDWYQEMLDKKVLTKAVVEQLAELGLDVDKYVEGGKVKSLGGSGGKAKKLKLSGVNFDVPTTSVSLKSTPVPQAPKINLSVPKGSTRIAAAARPRSAVQAYKPQTFKNDLTKGIIRL